MTVAELIEKLQLLPDDAEVKSINYPASEMYKTHVDGLLFCQGDAYLLTVPENVAAPADEQRLEQ